MWNCLNFNLLKEYIITTRMHSSRMRTVSNSSRLRGGGAWSRGVSAPGDACSGGCLLPGGGCLLWVGESAPGGCLLLGGWYPSMH